MPWIPRHPALFAAIGAVGLAVGLAGPPALARPDTALADHWQIVPGGQGAGLVIATARTSLWAFGSETTGKPASFFPVARHWDGQRWTRPLRVSSVKNSYVVCAGSSSDSNVWAFIERRGGQIGNPPNYAAAVRLRHGRWVTELTFSNHGGTIMTGCNVLSPTDVWIFGGAVAGPGNTVGTWHLTRSGWRTFNTRRLVIFNASVVSATDIWGAAATYKGAQALPALARWNGKNWTPDRSIDAVLPKPTSRMQVVIGAVNALSDRDVWVEATTTNFQHGTQSTVVVHWDGRAWHRVRRSFFGYYLPTAVPDGHGGWWAVPYLSRSFRYLLHGTRGHWTKIPMPRNVLVDAYNVNLSHVPHSVVTVADGFLYGPHGAVSVVLASGPLPR